MPDPDLPLAADALADTVLLSSTVAIVAVDLDGRVILWNRGATRIFGWTEEEARGEFLPFMPPEHEEEYLERLERLRAGEEFEELEMTHRTRDGAREDLLVSLRGLRGSDGELRAILGVAKEAGGRHEAERLLRRIESLELRLSETHLPPHFLLNSLHAIGVLVREERSREAVEALASVGDILRRAIRRPGDEELPLGEEIDLARKYVAVERARFGSDLRLEVDVDEELRQALVPNLILQPLVENAVRHGLAPRGGRGTLRITATAGESGLELAVVDDGVGLPGDGHPGSGRGVGLRAVRARLLRLYGDEGKLRIERADEAAGGTRAVVSLPHRTEEAASARAS